MQVQTGVVLVVGSIDPTLHVERVYSGSGICGKVLKLPPGCTNSSIFVTLLLVALAVIKSLAELMD
jgi:hypothetical protein